MGINLMTATSTAQAICVVQQRLQGLHVATMNHRRTPDGFSRELKRDVAMHRRRAIAEEWCLQQFLPTEAPNDPPVMQPGAA